MTWYPIEVLTLITKPSAFENSAEEPIHIIKLIKGVKLRSENWFTASLNMSPSKFEPAAEKITENITDNPEPQSLIDSPTITCILYSHQIFYDKTITLGMLMKSGLGLQRLWFFSGADQEHSGLWEKECRRTGPLLK